MQILRKLKLNENVIENRFGEVRLDMRDDFKTNAYQANLIIDVTAIPGILCSLQIHYGLARRNIGLVAESAEISRWLLRPTNGKDEMLKSATMTRRFKQVVSFNVTLFTTLLAAVHFWFCRRPRIHAKRGA